MEIKPDAEIVHPDFGSQARLKARQVVRTRTPQAKGIQEFVVDRFNESRGCWPTTAATLWASASACCFDAVASPTRRDAGTATGGVVVLQQSLYRPHRRPERASQDWADAAMGALARQTRWPPGADHGCWPTQSQSR